MQNILTLSPPMTSVYYSAMQDFTYLTYTTSPHHKNSTQARIKRDASDLVVVSTFGELSFEDALPYKLSRHPHALFEAKNILSIAEKPPIAHAIRDHAADASIEAFTARHYGQEIAVFDSYKDSPFINDNTPETWTKREPFCEFQQRN
ncbi:hypothetical protein DPMN_038734 [Dreissena polymorpha]|uniref:Uncharacterized protein n=1 Tax=Dreissena polymorpha TaxID=45954 RepID=A0A9D4MF75_DREPO|nr:hypothetical protein DPMN_038734 [Dreissena polymorpha]